MAQAFIIGEKFIGKESVCLILGDNIFYGHGLSDMLKSATSRKDGATIFAYHVTDPERYGIVEFDKNDIAISIEEKPKNPKSNYAVTGIYFYDNRVIQFAKNIKPSSRGELEITDINNFYLKLDKLKVEIMGRGFSWLDMGTHESLIAAGNFIQAIELSQGLKIGCLEEIAFRNSWLTRDQLKEKGKMLSKTVYGQYLIRIANLD